MRTIVTAAACVAALFMGHLLLDRPDDGRPTVDVPRSACTSTAPERHGDSAPDVHTGVRDGFAFDLVRNGFVRMRTCRPGRLTIEAHGSTAFGLGARTVVSVGTDVIWEGVVVGHVRLELDTPTNGWVTIGFVNDAGRGEEDRNLWLDHVSFVPH